MYHVSSVIVVSEAAWPFCLFVFAEFVCVSVHTRVSVDNKIGAEGAKALGNALKDTTTLASLWLDLRGEWILSVLRALRANVAGRLMDSLFFVTSQVNDIGQRACVELFYTLIEHCRLTSLEISLEGLLAFASYA
jgi:hypothetical protein